MQEPTDTDAVLGGKIAQSSDAVLGGIQGARRRLELAQTFSDRHKAIQALAKYSPEEARLATQQLLTIKFRPIGNTAWSQADQDQLRQANENAVKGFMALGQLIGQAFTNVQPQISQALNNLAALSSVNPEQMAQAVTEQMSISQLAKKLETSQLAKKLETEPQKPKFILPNAVTEQVSISQLAKNLKTEPEQPKFTLVLEDTPEAVTEQVEMVVSIPPSPPNKPKAKTEKSAYLQGVEKIIGKKKR